MISATSRHRTTSALLVTLLVVPSVLLSTSPAQEAPPLPNAGDACRAALSPTACAAAEKTANDAQAHAVGAAASATARVEETKGQIAGPLASAEATAKESGRKALLGGPVVVWTNLNMGAGSGLDADTLDGIEGATLVEAIGTEAATREAADTALDARIDDLEARPGPSIDLFTATGSVSFRSGGYTDVGIRVHNVELKEGDLVRLTLSGQMAARTPRSAGTSVGIAFAFNGQHYLPTWHNYVQGDEHYMMLPTIFAAGKVGSSGAQIPPGTYTISVQAYGGGDLGSVNLYGPTLYVERLSFA